LYICVCASFARTQSSSIPSVISKRILKTTIYHAVMALVWDLIDTRIYAWTPRGTSGILVFVAIRKETSRIGWFVEWHSIWTRVFPTLHHSKYGDESTAGLFTNACPFRHVLKEQLRKLDEGRENCSRKLFTHLPLLLRL